MTGYTRVVPDSVFDLLGPHHDLEDKSMVWNGWVRVKQTLTRVSVFFGRSVGAFSRELLLGKGGPAA